MIVIGAGFAGLAAAEALARGGVEVEVLEARDRVGGRVWSVPFAGGVVERGAEFVLPHDETVIATADRLGLTLARKGTLYGWREPRGAGAVTIDQVAEAMPRLSAGLESAGRADGTVARALAGSSLDPHIAVAIAARTEVSCAYGAEDLDASVLRAGASAFGRFDSFSFAGGNACLAEALAKRLPPVRFDAPVRRLSWSAEAGVRASTEVAELTADAAVVAVPASVLEAIEFDPPLPADKYTANRGVRYGQAAKLFVGLRAPAPPSQTLSVPDRFWCYTQLDRGARPAPFLAAFAGSPAALERLEIGRGPRTWLHRLASLRPDLALNQQQLMLSRWDDDPWVRGAYSARSSRSPMDTAALVRALGPLAFAGEHTAGEWHGLMEGALRSGERAARDLLAAY